MNIGEGFYVCYFQRLVQLFLPFLWVIRTSMLVSFIVPKWKRGWVELSQKHGNYTKFDVQGLISIVNWFKLWLRNMYFVVILRVTCVADSGWFNLIMPNFIKESTTIESHSMAVIALKHGPQVLVEFVLTENHVGNGSVWPNTEKLSSHLVTLVCVITNVYVCLVMQKLLIHFVIWY